MERRFGGVGAPLGSENVPDIHTGFFRKIKKCQFFWLDRCGDDPAYEVDYDVSGTCLHGLGLGRR